MKKTYDWNIRLAVTVMNNQRNIQIVSSIHTNIHQLKIVLAKKLGISILDSHIDLYYKGDRPMKATSTLLQNEVENNSHITANIIRLKVVEHLDVDPNKKQNKQRDKNLIDMRGLSLISSCTNSKCANYNQDVEIDYGFGTFSILQLTAETKCEICPYKSQFLRPSMLCKSIRVNRCFYKLKGIELDKGGIPVPRQSAFIKTEKQKDIHNFIGQNNWNINMQLVIKQL